VVHDTRAYPYILLGIALVIALGSSLSRIPRHGECGRHGHLYQFNVAEPGGHLVGYF